MKFPSPHKSHIIMGLLVPNPRKFFEKNLTKNFQTIGTQNKLLFTVGEDIILPKTIKYHRIINQHAQNTSSVIVFAKMLHDATFSRWRRLGKNSSFTL